MGDEYCSNCGAELEAGANFCSECGEEVGAADTRWGEESGAAGTQWGETGRSRRTGGSGDDTTFAAITHVLALLTWVIGPLIVLLATDDEFTRENARNALNWQIMFTIYMLISVVLVFLLVGIPLLIVLPILDLVFCVLAAVKASDGEAWRYPLTLDIV